MIVDTMSMEEIQKEVAKIYLTICDKAYLLATTFRKRVKKQIRGKLIVWKHCDIIYVNGNKILIYYMTRGSLNEFSQCFFIQVNNSKNYKEFYQVHLGGYVRKLSKHFIDRFIERTNCPEDFIPYFLKEFSFPVSLNLISEKSFIRSENGIAVVADGNILVTYMNDLSQYKTEIRDNLKITDKEAFQGINMLKLNKEILLDLKLNPKIRS